MGLEVFVTDEQTSCPIDATHWAEFARAVLGSLAIEANAELAISFVDESTITGLNERFMGHAGPTDVLSFPIEDDPLSMNPPSRDRARSRIYDGRDIAPLMLGDVVICPSVAERNASAEGVGKNDEIAHLLVHGILHLLGMDHEDDADAEVMEEKERKLLRAHRVQQDKPTT
jgi:probable rRNA maturation factor